MQCSGLSGSAGFGARSNSAGGRLDLFFQIPTTAALIILRLDMMASRTDVAFRSELRAEFCCTSYEREKREIIAELMCHLKSPIRRESQLLLHVAESIWNKLASAQLPHMAVALLVEVGVLGAPGIAPRLSRSQGSPLQSRCVESMSHSKTAYNLLSVLYYQTAPE
jgi:hypothetical protein